jgi:hypothetical protein
MFALCQFSATTVYFRQLESCSSCNHNVSVSSTQQMPKNLSISASKTNTNHIFIKEIGTVYVVRLVVLLQVVRTPC